MIEKRSFFIFIVKFCKFFVLKGLDYSFYNNSLKLDFLS